MQGTMITASSTTNINLPPMTSDVQYERFKRGAATLEGRETVVNYLVGFAGANDAGSMAKRCINRLISIPYQRRFSFMGSRGEKNAIVDVINPIIKGM